MRSPLSLIKKVIQLKTEESEQIRITIANFIQNNEKPTYSQILNYCTEECGFSKNKVNGVIQTAKNQYWKAIKEQKYNNRDVYILLDKQDRCDNLDRVEE